MRLCLLLFLVAGCTHPPETVSEVAAPLKQTPASQDIGRYKRWIHQQSSLQPQEQKLIENYLLFLQLQKNQPAQKLIQQLVQNSKKNHTPVAYQTFGIFKNSPQLIYKSQSLAALSMKHLSPLIEQGNAKAIEIFLVYSASVAIDSREAELLNPLFKTIYDKHPEVVMTVNHKHQDFFRQFPPMMIQ